MFPKSNYICANEGRKRREKIRIRKRTPRISARKQRIGPPRNPETFGANREKRPSPTLEKLPHTEYQPYYLLTMSKILIIGSSNIDLIACVKHLPAPGETVGEARFMQSNGGKGANQAVAAARLGGDVTFVSCLGDDANAASLRQQFSNDGIDTRALLTASHTPTGTALIYVAEDGENCIAVAPGANRLLGPEAIDALTDRIAEADYLLLQLEIPMESVARAIEKAAEVGTRVILNPAPAHPIADELLRKIYLITPNRSESEILTGCQVRTPQEASEAAARLLEKGVENVIITLGCHGALIRTPHAETIVPACKVTAVDTTAAGDVFNGALVVALAEGMTLVEGARFAARCSAVSVTRPGAQTSIPWRSEIDAR